ncbi:glycoside hydrolase family 27 protein [Fulvivirgaceae bacterium BMA12]|uniref:Alpha-galactosidase n=1 Tax=Agaribacillus aureus TaxID=3051825 RepID=A0ABT8KZ93_9BACT|nr:glycoside hydrolase family 27 protein [Fulvivirgaceae bacterium BMA12]
MSKLAHVSLIPVLLIFLLFNFYNTAQNINSGQNEKLADNNSASGREKVAQTPPMGWNSYNSYGAAVREVEVKANADYMAKYMKDYGWEYVVVDYCWSYPHPPGSFQNNPPQFRLEKDGAYVPWLAMDEFGRLLPDPGKFPSARNGEGFKKLADYIHSLGLKFGIHVMRGIPRQAVWAKTPIYGVSNIDASMIADTTSICPWLNQMYGIDMSKPGAQEYYNSLIDLYASWGVDYIKVDDIDLKENYPYRASEVDAIRKAIDQNGRPIVLSLSLNMKYKNREHVQKNGDLWRISKDFWDEWALLKNQFLLCAKWAGMSGPNSWPDADMLQIGWISRRGPHGPERESRFTSDEQRTHITLWCIANSPLMMGGDMPDNSEFVKSLLTNEEVLAVNQKGYDSKQLMRKDDEVVWVSKVPDSRALNVALFNLGDVDKEIVVKGRDLGFSGKFKIRNIWEKQDVSGAKRSLSYHLKPHESMLFLVSPM